jgi:hypothetical protein
MPPKINLEQYKEEILTWLENGVSYDGIISKISCSHSLFKRQFASWNILRNKKGFPEVERIKLDYRFLFG